LCHTSRWRLGSCVRYNAKRIGYACDYRPFSHPGGLTKRPNACSLEPFWDKALAVAQRQSARFWELRAALDLARLWRDQGKWDEARDLLAPVYGWFTEGFGTRDLKDAKALLNEL
jgi:hypothetical protein